MTVEQAGTATGTPPPGPGTGRTHSKGLQLAVIALAQLMIILDATIVTIALPSAQHALHISTANRQWVITAYTLAFGGLLLLGGRIADYMGRRRMMLIGLIAFALASAVGGFAVNFPMLLIARAVQGAFAALMAPAALALLTVTFAEGRERARAFAVFGAIAGGGSAVGLVLGGVLSEFASWRWCLLVNVPMAAIAAVGTLLVLNESKAEGDTRYDIPGAVTVSAGLAILVYGFTRAATAGWGDPATVACLCVAIALLVVFVLIEQRSRNPMLPLRVVLERNRGGSYLSSLLVGAGMLGVFLFLTYYFQSVLHYSALKAGLAFLPFSAGIVVGSALASQLLPRIGPRLLMTFGFLVAAGGMFWFTGVGTHGDYLGAVLVPELLVAGGLGLAFTPLASTALLGVASHDAGVASAMINATQQVGGSLGTALLNTVAANATAAYLVSHGPTSVLPATVHGYVLAFGVAAGIMAFAALTSFVLVTAGRHDVHPEAGVAVGA